MSLVAGTRLGAYEVVALIGAGGMGEVYKARDTRLDRPVAVKVLPSHLATHPGALARFEREAKAVAALSHPNILSIHDIGSDQGLAYAVMELLDGETLRARLNAGPLVWRRAASVAVAVADGLAAAHARGIVHRDLKPENVFLTTSGQVKILDFGLARSVGLAATGAGTTRVEFGHVTQPGTVLGTVGYMSPEQVRGEETGPASDIFAFGCLLHEMLTGRGPFERGTPAETLAAVLRDDPPPLTGVDVPSALDALVRHCLEKQPQNRFQSAGDMGFALRAVLDARSVTSAVTASSVSPSPMRARMPWLLAAAATLGLALGGFGTWIVLRFTASRAAVTEPTHLSLSLPRDGPLEPNDSPSAGSSIAISQDGRWIAYAALRDGQRRLVIRGLSQARETVLPGTEGALTPIFSPDAQWVAYFTEYDLRKVPLAGGTPTTIAEVPPVTRGATWADDGRIYFGPDFSSGLVSVPASGGSQVELTTVDLAAGESNHLLPEVLPGSHSLLFTMWKGGDFSAASIWSLSLATGQRTLVLESASAPRYLPPGFLLFARNGALFAARFDPDRLAVIGEAVPIVDGVWTDRATGTLHYAVARNGTLVYAPGGNTIERRRLVWVDRQGRVEPLPADPAFYGTPRLSPDGRRIVVDALNDLWLYAIEERTLTRLTFRGVNNLATWTPDGRRVTFSSSQGFTTPTLFWTDVEAGGQPELLHRDATVQFPCSWAPDGSVLAYAAFTPGPTGAATGWDLWALRPGSTPSPLVRTPFKDDQGMFSPDGRALAYVSNETGELQVYARAFPDTTRRIRVSTDGGTEPVWARKGGELFYRRGQQYFSVPMNTGGDTLKAGLPTLLFTGTFIVASVVPGSPSYDVSPDDQRFLMVARVDDTPRPSNLAVILGWNAELQRRLPLGTGR